jgi:DNA-binding PadR family transcriptional regulator
LKYELLTLLANRPQHGYALKQAFEMEFGVLSGSVNIGQVYTTLGRLERDGLVRQQTVEQESRPDKHVYELTEAGREAAEAWMDRPSPASHVRQEFFSKLALARRTGIRDVSALIERDREEFLRALRELDSLELPDSFAARLMVEGAALHLGADLKWLDACESALNQITAEEEARR